MPKIIVTQSKDGKFYLKQKAFIKPIPLAAETLSDVLASLELKQTLFSKIFKTNKLEIYMHPGFNGEAFTFPKFKRTWFAKKYIRLDE